MKLTEILDWSLVYNENPLVQEGALQGLVYNHDRLPDGLKIVTSPIECIWQDERGVRFAQTKNTLYRLVNIDPDYFLWLKEQGKNIEILFEQYKKDV